MPPLAVVSLLFAGGAAAAPPTIYADYTTACAFSLVDDSGRAVASIASGTYQLVVQTPFAFAAGGASCEHIDFHLTGPGANVATLLGGGDSQVEQFTVTFQPTSSYVAQDPTQPSPTRIPFTTTSAIVSAGATTTTSSGGNSSGGSKSTGVVGSAVLPARGALAARVTAAGALALTRSGRAVSTLKAGRYTVTVTDSSTTAGFALQRLRGAAQTLSGKARVGSVRVTVSLGRGQWFFYSPGGARHYFIVIA